MMRNTLVILTCFVLSLYFVYINADLNLQENDINEIRNLQQNIDAYSFADQDIHPPLRADCDCKNGKCANEGEKVVCKCPPGYGNYTQYSCRACECGPNKSCIWIETGWFSSDKICFCNTGYFVDNGKCIADPCSSNPCKNGGSCAVSGSNFTCSCVKPYAGLTCETILADPCTPNPCQNEGTCSVVGQDLKCSCKSPFKGNLCEIGPCSSNPCQNGGKCSVDGKNFKCECKPPFKGNKCEIDPCTPNPCKNEGTCSVVGQDVKCSCKAPFKGNFCEIGLCSSNPCQNGGKCSVDGKNYKCECKSPFKGKNCETGPCSTKPCQNGGKCSVNGQNFKCSCEKPFTGKLCEKGPCTSNPCQNTGICTVKGQSFKCECQKPYKGEKCEISPCTSNPCQNKGKCKVDKENFKCECEKPYKGNLCQDGPCSSNPCQNNGDCIVDELGFQCKCKQPFKGENCEIGPCFSNPCLNNGKCKVVGMNYQCDCPLPYKGNQCEKDPCTSSPCFNKGNCTIKGNSFKCACKSPYFGDTCEKDPCSSSPCLNGGSCKIKGNTYSCDCSQDYVGDKCQFDCDCKNGKCQITSAKDVVCECLPEYGKNSDVCEACNCGTGANCTFESGFWGFGETKYCLCPDGSKLEEQHCEDPCRSNPCLHNGKCKVEGKNFKCECTPPYTGPTCKDDICTKNPCLNGGACKINATSLQCKCKIPYSGKLCEEDPCTKNPCENGGTCRLKDNSSKCDCKPPYFGDKCEKEISTPPTETTTHSSKTTVPSFSTTKTLLTTSPLMSTSWNNTTADIFTEEINMTTSEPSNFSYDFNWTTSEPSNFTEDFNKTTFEPSNFTIEFNRTTYEPSNFTFDFNETTYEPQNFTYDVNMTSYEPYNITNENSTSETTPFIFTTSVPITTKKPGVCDDNPCQNGGTCREEKGIAKCVCPPHYAGENCTDVLWCIEGEGKELCQGGGCTFDFQSKLGRCTCPDDKYYNYERKKCEVVDRCPFISKKCNEENNEVCKNGECQCKDDFKIDSDRKCVPNFCALNPCKENEDCEDIENDPGYVKCKCKEGYIFNGDYCMEDNVCSVPIKLKCQQICDIDTQSCDCYSGFILQSDNKTCVRESSTKLCSMDCGVGTCVEVKGSDTCLCPPTHVFNGTTCIDLCTANQIPEGLCPDNACIVDKEMVFKCKCDGKFAYNENGFTCRRKHMCTEGGGKETCKKRNAICMEDFSHPDGFTCKCEEGLGEDTDGTCKRKCDLPSQKEKC
ncbi:unnamed protein product, partial [Larinioides sclopetarius]